MLMASSGFLAVTMQDQKDKVIDKALRAGVVISALDSKGLYAEATPGSRPEDAVGYPTGSSRMAKAAQDYNSYEISELPFRLDTLNEPMENLAESTGGIFYHNNNDLAAGFRKLGDPPEWTYRLAFHAEGSEGYHKLKVVVHKDVVQARPGYFLAPETESLQARIDREMTLDEAVSEFPMEIAAEQEKSGVAILVKVDISKLRFEKTGDRRTQKLAFVTSLTDAKGRVVAAKESTMDFALTDATYGKLAAQGIKAKVTFAVPAGAYKLRQVSEEALDGKMACVSHVISVK
jgi:hypothetical protein